MASNPTRKRVCIIGCGPAGMSALYHYSKMPGVSDTVDIVCYEKKSDWGGLWNIDWRTGKIA